MAFAGKVGRGGLARRVLVATLVIMVVLLLGKHVSRGVSGVGSVGWSRVAPSSPFLFFCLYSSRCPRNLSGFPFLANVVLEHLTSSLRIRPSFLLKHLLSLGPRSAEY
jgi:hypothetical protein